MAIMTSKTSQLDRYKFLLSSIVKVRKDQVTVKALQPRKPVVTILKYRVKWKNEWKTDNNQELLKFHFR